MPVAAAIPSRRLAHAEAAVAVVSLAAILCLLLLVPRTASAQTTQAQSAQRASPFDDGSSVTPGGTTNTVVGPLGPVSPDAPAWTAEALQIVAAMIYELNRARAVPKIFAAEHDLGDILDGVMPRGPLSPNPELFASALARTDNLARDDYFGHENPYTGVWPNWYVRNEGYDLPSRWRDDSNHVESLAGGFLHPTVALAALIADEDFDPPGHRYHLLATGPDGDAWAQHNEIGVGFTRNEDAYYGRYFAIHTAYRPGRGPFATGVVYSDNNGNGRYDLGEGISGVEVSLQRIDAADGEEPLRTVSTFGGLWWMELPADGEYVVAAEGESFGLATSNVTLQGESLVIDFRLGDRVGEVDFENQRVVRQPYPTGAEHTATAAGANADDASLDGLATAPPTSPSSGPFSGGGCALGGDSPFSAGPLLAIALLLLALARRRFVGVAIAA